MRRRSRCYQAGDGFYRVFVNAGSGARHRRVHDLTGPSHSATSHATGSQQNVLFGNASRAPRTIRSFGTHRRRVVAADFNAALIWSCSTRRTGIRQR